MFGKRLSRIVPKALMVGVGVGFVLGGVEAARAQTHYRPKRRIHFSDTSDSNFVTNMDDVTPGKNNLKQLEDDLFKPLEQSFAPQNSMNGVVPLPYVPQPVVPNKKTREMLEKKKNMSENWVFIKPEDMIPGITAEEIFQIKDFDENGQEKEKLSPAAAYLQDLSRKNGKNSDRMNSKKDQASGNRSSSDNPDDNPDDADADSKKAAASKDTDQFGLSLFSRGMLEPEADSAGTPASDFFGGQNDDYNARTEMLQREHERQQQREDYGKIIGIEPITTASLWDGSRDTVAASAPTAPLVGQFAPATSLLGSTMPAMPTVATPNFGTIAQPGLGAPASTPYTPPAPVAAPDRPAPVEGSFIPPKRVF